MQNNRRKFLKMVAAGVAAKALPGFAQQLEKEEKTALSTKLETGKPLAQTVLPRWRGFNLLYLFTKQGYSKPVEDDFRWIADLGFDFLRLPMDYRIWIEDNDVNKIKEEPFENIDRVVEWGRKYKIHICLNFHRGPGYCVNQGWIEPFNLWKDQKALDAFCFHWQLFAKRYNGVPSSAVSFDLINEPPAPSETMSRADYERVVRATTKTIRDADKQRLIIIDGLSTGNDPVPELIDLGVAQSCRGYIPPQVSHYRANWVDRDSSFPTPIWPDKEHKTHHWDRDRLQKHYQLWADLAKRGVGVHCGEGGAYSKTPHEVFLAWWRDVLEILTGFGIGWALWNFRGSFGILDSGREDVQYEDFHGHKLDRKLLELLQEFK
ncbi:MAG: cellulase family glycosylhydrolase [Sedimentisphaerales bacterium]|nr:cellulase family glycosylhydrolase [Sedimentisphaerales bacterium]